MRKRLAIASVLLIAVAVYAQQSSSKPGSPTSSTSKQAGTSTSKPAASASGQSSSVQPKLSLKGWKTYCSEEGAYCISYPPDWSVVGDVFEGNGVVMAPPQERRPKSEWSQVTSSVSFLPETQGDQEAPTFDEILSAALKDLPGKNVQTVQRTELTLVKRPAQLVRVKYEDAETGKPWVEDIVFIDDGDAIYSTALRAMPEDLEKWESTFRTIVATWRPIEEAPAVPPSSTTPPKKPTPKPAAPGATKVTPQ